MRSTSVSRRPTSSPESSVSSRTQRVTTRRTGRPEPERQHGPSKGARARHPIPTAHAAFTNPSPTASAPTGMIGPSMHEKRGDGRRRMRVGVVDIGANTIRLLVAAPAGGGVVPVHRERVRLGLGEHVEKMGRLPQTAIDDARRAARKQVAIARRLGCSRVEIVVTSPGRQAANADALVFSLAGISDATVRVLSAEDEAVYAYHGALSGLDGLPET